MGENVLRIKAIAETGDVQATLDELGGNFTKLGKTAIEASAGSKQAWRDLGAAIAEAVPGCDSVAQAIERVATTSDKLGDAGASGNIKRMQSALEASGLAIMDLQAQYEKVTAVAPELGVELAGAGRRHHAMAPEMGCAEGQTAFDSGHASDLRTTGASRLTLWTART